MIKRVNQCIHDFNNVPILDKRLFFTAEKTICNCSTVLGLSLELPQYIVNLTRRCLNTAGIVQTEDHENILVYREKYFSNNNNIADM